MTSYFSSDSSDMTIQNNVPPFIRSELFSTYGWHGIFSMRYGGCSPAPFDSLNLGFDLGDEKNNVLKNHEMLMHQVGLDGFPHQAQQKHGSEVLCCSGEGQMHEKEADVLLAYNPCALAVRTADCVPILLVDPVNTVFAAVHAGWRGTAQQIVKKAVHQMLERGAKLQYIIASIGPCIGLCCFQINEAVAEKLLQASCGNNHAVQHDDVGQCSADLSAINRYQLLDAGILNQHIEKQPYCTMCAAQMFFSYRRDGAKTGRLLAIVAAKKL